MANSSYEDIFGVAVQFVLATQRTASAIPPLAYPTIAMSSFALELLFKAVLAKEVQPPQCGHNLEHLFSVLPRRYKVTFRNLWKREIQSKLKKPYTTLGIEVPNSLDICLSKAAFSFEKFRYAYEGKLPDHALHGLEKAIMDWLISEDPKLIEKIPTLVWK